MEQLRRFLTAYEKGCAGIRADYKLLQHHQAPRPGLSTVRRSQMDIAGAERRMMNGFR